MRLMLISSKQSLCSLSCARGATPWAGSVEVIPAPDLLSLLNHLRGTALLPVPTPGVAEVPGIGP